MDKEVKELAKIESIKFGYGGHQDIQFGLSICFSGKGFGVCWFDGAWSLDTEWTSDCKWTEADRDKVFSKIVRLINETLKKAKKRTLDELKNVPVELTLSSPGAGSTIKSWRILEEVL